jgi:hypothetical protein
MPKKRKQKRKQCVSPTITKLSSNNSAAQPEQPSPMTQLQQVEAEIDNIQARYANYWLNFFGQTVQSLIQGGISHELVTSDLIHSAVIITEAARKEANSYGVELKSQAPVDKRLVDIQQELIQLINENKLDSVDAATAQPN